MIEFVTTHWHEIAITAATVWFLMAVWRGRDVEKALKAVIAAVEKGGDSKRIKNEVKNLEPLLPPNAVGAIKEAVRDVSKNKKTVKGFMKFLFKTVLPIGVRFIK